MSASERCGVSGKCAITRAGPTTMILILILIFLLHQVERTWSARERLRLLRIHRQGFFILLDLTRTRLVRLGFGIIRAKGKPWSRAFLGRLCLVALGV